MTDLELRIGQRRSPSPDEPQARFSNWTWTRPGYKPPSETKNTPHDASPSSSNDIPRLLLRMDTSSISPSKSLSERIAPDMLDSTTTEIVALGHHRVLSNGSGYATPVQSMSPSQASPGKRLRRGPDQQWKSSPGLKRAPRASTPVQRQHSSASPAAHQDRNVNQIPQTHSDGIDSSTHTMSTNIMESSKTSKTSSLSLLDRIAPFVAQNANLRASSRQDGTETHEPIFVDDQHVKSVLTPDVCDSILASLTIAGQQYAEKDGNKPREASLEPSTKGKDKETLDTNAHAASLRDGPSRPSTSSATSQRTQNKIDPALPKPAVAPSPPPGPQPLPEPRSEPVENQPSKSIAIVQDTSSSAPPQGLNKESGLATSSQLPHPIASSEAIPNHISAPVPLGSGTNSMPLPESSTTLGKRPSDQPSDSYARLSKRRRSRSPTPASEDNYKDRRKSWERDRPDYSSPYNPYQYSPVSSPSSSRFYHKQQPYSHYPSYPSGYSRSPESRRSRSPTYRWPRYSHNLGDRYHLQWPDAFASPSSPSRHDVTYSAYDDRRRRPSSPTSPSSYSRYSSSRGYQAQPYSRTTKSSWDRESNYEDDKRSRRVSVYDRMPIDNHETSATAVWRSPASLTTTPISTGKDLTMASVQDPSRNNSIIVPDLNKHMDAMQVQKPSEVTEPLSPIPLGVPGLWLKEESLAMPGIIECTFTVDNHTALLWNIPSLEDTQNAGEQALSKGENFRRRKPPTVSLKLKCLPQELVNHVQESSENDTSLLGSADALSRVKCNWPAKGTLIIDVNSKESIGRTLYPHDLDPTCPFVELNMLVHEGQNLIRFIQVGQVPKSVFIVYSSPLRDPSEEGELQEGNGQVNEISDNMSLVRLDDLLSKFNNSTLREFSLLSVNDAAINVIEDNYNN